MTGDEDRGNEGEADDHHDHGKDGGDRQGVILEEAKLRLFRHLGRDTNAGVENVGGRGRPTASTNLVEAVDDSLGECRPPVEDEGE